MITRLEQPYDPEYIKAILHPLVKSWFFSKFNEFSLPQRYGVLEIHQRKNVLISAPTGATKTLTGFLAILNELVDSAKKQILEFIQAKKLGSKQSKLLRTLSGTIPVPMSVLERNTRTKNLKALVRDTRKMLEKSHFEIKLVRSSSISKENAYQLSVISQ